MCVGVNSASPLLMSWSQRSQLTIMVRSRLHTYKRVFSPSLIFLPFFNFHPFLYLLHSYSSIHSLLSSLSPGHYSVLPLNERLLFKTLRSDLVPTESIPLAALCIYHGSPILSRLLMLQFSLSILFFSSPLTLPFASYTSPIFSICFPFKAS